MSVMDEHLKDAEEQQGYLRQLHLIANHMRTRERVCPELAGLHLYFPKTSDDVLTRYEDRIIHLKAVNEKRKAAAKPKPGPSEAPSVAPSETTTRKRKASKRTRRTSK